jgi:hypothetical protein
MSAERVFNPGGEKFLLAALEKIAAMPPRLTAAQLIDQFVEMRLLARRAIAYATTPLDCPGVKGMPFTHLFVGDPARCARCGLASSEYLGELSTNAETAAATESVAAVAGGEQDKSRIGICTPISQATQKGDGDRLIADLEELVAHDAMEDDIEKARVALRAAIKGDGADTPSSSEAREARDLILEARKMWWEIVESDGGECRHMGIVRELADHVERLLSHSSAKGK